MIEGILNERQQTHGDFKQVAIVSQSLKETIKQHTTYHLSIQQKEALDNICQKIARILCGNPNHLDSWIDIIGYSQLIVNQLNTKDLVSNK